jgi:hypothetical protein
VTGDIRKQLIEALDQAEKLAKAAIQGPWRRSKRFDRWICPSVPAIT